MPAPRMAGLILSNEVRKYQRYHGETLLYTGDLFRKDEDGYLYFAARRNDLIKTGGERISPKEIALQELKDIGEVVAIGVPDEILGQAIKVFVVTNCASPLTEEAIMRHCRENLESCMIPKYVEFRASLPKLTSGKIDKKRFVCRADSG